MKKCFLVVAMAASAGTAVAADFVDTARVVASMPVYERISEPKQECWTETVGSVSPPAPERSMSGSIIGGLAGGLLGNQFGGGQQGNAAATAIGAAAGAIVGDRVANPDSNRPLTGSIVGGVAGGLLGTQVGRGSGQDVAAATGAIAGTIIGDRVANPTTAEQQPQQVQHCRQVDSYRDVVSGYNVTYRYAGKDVTVRLPYDPGSTVRVGVSVLSDTGSNNAPRDYRSGDRR